MNIRRDNKNRRISFIEEIKQIKKDIKKTLEIGVAAGDFSEQIVEQLKPEIHYMVDPWMNEGDEKRSQWFLRTSAEESYQFVKQRFANKSVSINRAMSYDYLLQCVKKEEKFDLIYVDGDHHAEAVYLDLMLSWECIDKGGILCGDDLNWKSKTTGLYEVLRGVEKFATQQGLKYTVIKGNNGGLNQFYFIKE